MEGSRVYIPCIYAVRRSATGVADARGIGGMKQCRSRTTCHAYQDRKRWLFQLTRS